jgi:hypothetical protein
MADGKVGAKVTAPTIAVTNDSVVTLIFGPNQRDVTMEINGIKHITARKIEYASKLLIRNFRIRLGEEMSKTRRIEMAREAEEHKKVMSEQAEKDKQFAEANLREQEAFEKSEFERLSKKYSNAKKAV